MHPKSVEQVHSYFNKLESKPELDKEVIIRREKVQDFKNWMGK